MNSHLRFSQPSAKSPMALWCILPPVSRGYCFTHTRLWASVPQRDCFIRTTITKHSPKTLVCSYSALERRNEEKSIILDFRAVKASMNATDNVWFYKENLWNMGLFYNQVPTGLVEKILCSCLYQGQILGHFLGATECVSSPKIVSYMHPRVIKHVWPMGKTKRNVLSDYTLRNGYWLQATFIHNW